tara:strand:- start:567 stop:836 length:270 start_codon:yes stop_codon:yes gene_type:complete
MDTNKVTAIGVSIIPVGVIAGGITYGAKEYDKSRKENARTECMGKGSTYSFHMKNVEVSSFPDISQSWIDSARRALDECLAEKGLQLNY